MEETNGTPRYLRLLVEEERRGRSVGNRHEAILAAADNLEALTRAALQALSALDWLVGYWQGRYREGAPLHIQAADDALLKALIKARFNLTEPTEPVGGSST